MSVTHLELAHLFTDLVKKHLGNDLVSVVLFGSVATGHERPDSDVDILLVIKQLAHSRMERRKILDAVHAELDTLVLPYQRPFVSTILKTPDEALHVGPLYFDMVDRSLILYDQDGFFRNALAKVARRLQTLGAQRKKLGTIEYWDLKPDYVPGEIFEI